MDRLGSEWRAGINYAPFAQRPARRFLPEDTRESSRRERQEAHDCRTALPAPGKHPSPQFGQHRPYKTIIESAPGSEIWVLQPSTAEILESLKTDQTPIDHAARFDPRWVPRVRLNHPGKTLGISRKTLLGGGWAASGMFRVRKHFTEEPRLSVRRPAYRPLTNNR